MLTIVCCWHDIRLLDREGVGSRCRQRGLLVSQRVRSEEHTSELQSLRHLVCRLLLEKKNKIKTDHKQHKIKRENASIKREHSQDTTVIQTNVNTSRDKDKPTLQISRKP